MKIYKYTLAVQHYQAVEIPEDSVVLCVQVQHGVPQLWVLIGNGDPVKREIRTLMTGPEYDNSEAHGRYVGTYQLDGGNFVGHVFEGKRSGVDAHDGQYAQGGQYDR